jgi:hypothetical protein
MYAACPVERALAAAFVRLAPSVDRSGDVSRRWPVIRTDVHARRVRWRGCRVITESGSLPYGAIPRESRSQCRTFATCSFVWSFSFRAR